MAAHPSQRCRFSAPVAAARDRFRCSLDSFSERLKSQQAYPYSADQRREWATPWRPIDTLKGISDRRAATTLRKLLKRALVRTTPDGGQWHALIAAFQEVRTPHAARRVPAKALPFLVELFEQGVSDLPFLDDSDLLFTLKILVAYQHPRAVALTISLMRQQ